MGRRYCLYGGRAHPDHGPRPKETTLELPLPEVQTDWSDYYKNILAVLDGEAELIVRPEQALRVMKVIDAVFEADRLNCGVHCHI